MRILALVVVAAAVVALGVPVGAQQKRASPHETIKADIDGNEMSLEYGRPLTKSRKIWGGLVPYGKAWRTGADEATFLTISMPIMIGTETIPAGKYHLYTIPEEKGGKLAFGKSTPKWGVPVYEKEDLVRVDMQRKDVEKAVDQFTMAIEKGSKEGGVLKMTWENAEYSVAFTNAKKK